MRKSRSSFRFIGPVLATALLTGQNSAAQADDDGYKVTGLVSDLAGRAAHVDGNLQNPWGIAFNPNGAVWIANNGTGTSTLYDGSGRPSAQLPVVNIPGKNGGAGNPTGIAFNSSADFTVAPGKPAAFIFVNEGGTLAAWAPSADLLNAKIVGGAVPGQAPVYKGLALAGNGRGHFLYAADFRNGKIQVFNKDFHWVAFANPARLCKFNDPALPQGFAPFGIHNINGNLYVSYAKQDEDKEDDVAGPGLGLVNIFDADGCLVRRFAAHGPLNAPWGMALAPADFGRHGNQLLVANFGDGTINAFDLDSGEYKGALRDRRGDKVVVEGLWGLAFGNGVLNQPTHTLFFTAGPDDETHGLYGKIEAVK